MQETKTEGGRKREPGSSRPPLELRQGAGPVYDSGTGTNVVFEKCLFLAVGPRTAH